MLREVKSSADLLDLMADLHRVFLGFADKGLKEFHLRTGQASILMIIGMYGRLNQKVIAEYRYMSVGTISVLISRMERDGLVRRIEPLDGGKSSDVVLSEYGQAVYNSIASGMGADADKILLGLSQKDRDNLTSYYMQIMDNIKSMRNEDKDV